MDQRSERTGCREVVAGSDRDARDRAGIAAEPLDQGGLADPGLTPDEDEPPLAGRGLVQEAMEVVEERAPFEKFHAVVNRLNVR